MSRLLKHATDLQEEESFPRGPGSGTGITLAELQEIAAEAGIDPKYLQRAAARIDVPAPSGIGPALAGTPLTITVDRVVPGELHDDDFERIVPDIQRVSIGHGAASMVGRTLTWRSDTGQNQRSLQVTVSSRAGETRIQAEERLHGVAAALYGGVVGGAGVGVGVGVGLPLGIEVIGSALFAALFPVTIVAGLYLGVRQLLKRMGKKRRGELQGMVDQIAQYVRPAAEALEAHRRDALAPGSSRAPDTGGGES